MIRMYLTMSSMNLIYAMMSSSFFMPYSMKPVTLRMRLVPNFSRLQTLIALCREVSILIKTGSSAESRIYGVTTYTTQSHSRDVCRTQCVIELGERQRE